LPLPHDLDLSALQGSACEAIEIFELLPTVHAKGAAVGEAASLVLPALLAKARDDFEAILEATIAGRTSAGAMISRALLESTVDLFYLTSGVEADQERKAQHFLALVLTDQEQQRLVEEAMKQRTETRVFHQVSDPNMRREALELVTAELEAQGGGLPGQLLAILKPYRDKRSAPGYPRLKDRLTAVEAHPQVVTNLIGGYQRFYSAYSAFVHGTACMKYVVDIEVSGGARRTGLRRGSLPVGHLSPLATALIYVPDLLGRYDRRFQCGQAARVEGLARLRWDAIMGGSVREGV
jgi:hypothetical protein